MDDTPHGGPHRYRGAGRSGRALLPDGLELLQHAATGRRNVCHADALQLPLAALQREPEHRHGYPARPHLGSDAHRHLDRQPDGTHLLLRLHEGRTGLPALLCLSVALHHVHAGAGGSHEHLPDVPLLGAGGCIVLSAHRILLYQTCRHRRFEESVHRDALRRPGLPHRYPGVWLLCRHLYIHPH